MKYIVKNSSGLVKEVFLLDNVFCVEYDEVLVHQLVVYCIHKSHVGVKKQKNRSEVRGGGKKPWKQKGTGRARAGSIRSPLWKGGGMIFASRGVLKKIKINKKMYRLGVCMIFSELLRRGSLRIIDSIYLSFVKTYEFLKAVFYLDFSGTALFVVDDVYNDLYLSSRNLKGISVVSCRNMNPISLLKYNNIFLTRDSLCIINDMFGDKKNDELL